MDGWVGEWMDLPEGDLLGFNPQLLFFCHIFHKMNVVIFLSEVNKY